MTPSLVLLIVLISAVVLPPRMCFKKNALLRVCTARERIASTRQKILLSPKSTGNESADEDANTSSNLTYESVKAMLRRQEGIGLYDGKHRDENDIRMIVLVVLMILLFLSSFFPNVITTLTYVKKETRILQVAPRRTQAT
jgi:hypothetical protein